MFCCCLSRISFIFYFKQTDIFMYAAVLTWNFSKWFPFPVKLYFWSKIKKRGRLNNIAFFPAASRSVLTLILRSLFGFVFIFLLIVHAHRNRKYIVKCYFSTTFRILQNNPEEGSHCHQRLLQQSYFLTFALTSLQTSVSAPTSASTP